MARTTHDRVAGNHRITRLLAGLVLAAALPAAAACAGSGSSEYCDTLTNDPLGATLFTAYGAMPAPADWAKDRITLMDAAGAPPADLTEASTTFRDYLDAMSALTEDRTAEALALSTDDVTAARQALAKNFTSSCL